MARPSAPAPEPKKQGVQDRGRLRQRQWCTAGQRGVGGMGGAAKTAVDTNVYPEDKLSTKPKLISIPDASDDNRRKYPDMEVSVWVVIEKDGSVSRAESRSTTDNAGLDKVATGLARQARFSPGKKAGATVRASKTITVRIRSLKRQGRLSRRSQKSKLKSQNRGSRKAGRRNQKSEARRQNRRRSQEARLKSQNRGNTEAGGRRGLQNANCRLQNAE